MSKVLITYHTFTGKTKTLAEVAAEGAKSTGAEVVLKEVTDTTIQDLATADAILLATPQPFQIMAGETKKLFERLWRDREQIGDGKPFGVIICHSSDPSATLEAMDKFCNYYKLAKISEWITVDTAEIEAGKERCRQLGIVLGQEGRKSKHE